MTDIALRVHSLSKLYHIGARIDPHATLRDRPAGVLIALPALSQGRSTARSGQNNDPLRRARAVRDGGRWKAVSLPITVRARVAEKEAEDVTNGMGCRTRRQGRTGG